MNAQNYTSGLVNGAVNVVELLQTLGKQAKTASAGVSTASAAIKNAALLRLAALLRANVAALQADNAKDIARAIKAGLSEPMVDRLKLTPKVLETCAQGCEQLAASSPVAFAWGKCGCRSAFLA
jgi:glutamate-5-semialdehyde dehydrogenase